MEAPSANYYKITIFSCCKIRNPFKYLSFFTDRLDKDTLFPCEPFSIFQCNFTGFFHGIHDITHSDHIQIADIGRHNRAHGYPALFIACELKGLAQCMNAG